MRVFLAILYVLFSPAQNNQAADRVQGDSQHRPHLRAFLSRGVAIDGSTMDLRHKNLSAVFVISRVGVLSSSWVTVNGGQPLYPAASDARLRR